MSGRLFARRRDGRVEVRLNDAGRAVIREIFVHVVAAERSDEHEWHLALQTPINPSSDDDDPLSRLARQNEIATNAELAITTVSEQYLNDAEAWAWLSTLQVALRSTAVVHGILSDERLASAPPEVLEDIRTIQQFLFDLAACL